MWAHDYRRVLWGHHTDLYQGMGGYGVQLFFAISGILISWRILQDEKTQGFFSLQRFYVRRFFRIQPAQWVYLAFVATLMLLGLHTAQWKYWLGAVLQYENYLWRQTDQGTLLLACAPFGLFWTLAVEEHFYLLISLFYKVVRSWRGTVLGVAFLGLLVGQQWGRAHGLWSDDVSARRTPWNLHLLIFPALVALLLRKEPVMHFARRWWRPSVAFAFTIAAMYVHQLLYMHSHSFTPKALLTLNVVPLLYAFTGWVVASMLHPESWTTRFLELAPLRFVGRISYSLYLWHILFFGAATAQFCSSHFLTRLGEFRPTHYLCPFIAATASYYLVEKPMIRLGHRLAPPATPGHSDLREATPAA